jgi:hypothetical protein
VAGVDRLDKPRAAAHYYELALLDFVSEQRNCNEHEKLAGGKIEIALRAVVSTTVCPASQQTSEAKSPRESRHRTKWRRYSRRYPLADGETGNVRHRSMN